MQKFSFLVRPCQIRILRFTTRPVLLRDTISKIPAIKFLNISAGDDLILLLSPRTVSVLSQYAFFNWSQSCSMAVILIVGQCIKFALDLNIVLFFNCMISELRCVEQFPSFPLCTMSASPLPIEGDGHCWHLHLSLFWCGEETSFIFH